MAAYETTPGKQRTFCGRRGAPICSRYDDNPGFINLRSGTRGGEPGARPSSHIHVASKAPWIEITDGLPRSREEEGLTY